MKTYLDTLFHCILAVAIYPTISRSCDRPDTQLRGVMSRLTTLAGHFLKI